MTDNHQGNTQPLYGKKYFIERTKRLFNIDFNPTIWHGEKIAIDENNKLVCICFNENTMDMIAYGPLDNSFISDYRLNPKYTYYRKATPGKIRTSLTEAFWGTAAAMNMSNSATTKRITGYELKIGFFVKQKYKVAEYSIELEKGQKFIECFNKYC